MRHVQLFEAEVLDKLPVVGSAVLMYRYCANSRLTEAQKLFSGMKVCASNELQGDFVCRLYMM